MKLNLMGLSVILFFFFCTPIFAFSDCQPVFHYYSIKGNYTTELGLKNTELEDKLSLIANTIPEFCGVHVEIKFLEGLDPKQLVFDSDIAKDNNYYSFELQFYTPSYNVFFYDKNGDFIEDIHFNKELSYGEFIPMKEIYSEEELHDIWNTKRREEYIKLEKYYNDFPRLMDYLDNLLVEQTKETSFKEEETPPKSKLNNASESNNDQIASKSNSLLEEKKPKKSTQPNPSISQKSTQNRAQPKINSSNSKPEQLSNQGKGNDTNTSKKRGDTYEDLNDLIEFNFCSRTYYTLTNISYYTLLVEIGNYDKIDSQSYIVDETKSINRYDKVNKNSWYALHYPLELHQKDLKRYSKAIESIYRDLGILELGTDLAKEFIENLPDSYEHKYYDPGKEETVKEDISIVVEKFFADKGVDLYKEINEEYLKDQILFFHNLMIQSFLFHNLYLQVKKEGLPKFLYKDQPGYRTNLPRFMNPNIGLRVSGFAILGEEGMLNDYWQSNNLGFRGILQLGFPFEKSSKAIRNREYYRPYLVLGYEQLNIPIIDTWTNYVGADYIVAGVADEEYQLETSEGILLRSHSFQIGAIYKSLMASDIYVDIGGGIRKKWHSQLFFDDEQNYVGEDLALLSNKQTNVLQHNAINPYVELTIGRDFHEPNGNRCYEKPPRLDMFFSVYYSRVNIEQGDNFQLYQSSFDQLSALPYTSPSPNKKWYLMLSMGLGLNF